MLNHFLSGAIAMGCALAGLFFLRFWRRTHDRLFAMFAVSFWALSLERLVLEVVSTSEFRPYVYGIRLLAFGLIILAIADKNRTR